MLMAFGIVVIVVAMFHLFTVTWATSNAHLRAREALLHGDAYLSGETKNDYVEAGSTPFDPDTRQYNKARTDAAIMFNARAWDTTRDDLIGSDAIQVRIEMTN